MIDALAAAPLGFLLGLRHAADADHVVAVTAIVAREPAVGRAARVGALWGLGHALALLGAGGAIVGFRLAVPPRLGLALEFLVACMLVALGLANLRRGAAGAPGGRARDARRPLVVGTVHGLAGSAAVALLAAAAIPTTAGAVAYLLVFGAGTVAGMTLATALVAAPAALAGARVVRAQRAIRVAAGALSLVFGALLGHEVVVDGGLFAAQVRWSPR